MRVFKKMGCHPIPAGATIEKKNGTIAVWTDGSGQKKKAPVIVDEKGN